MQSSSNRSLKGFPQLTAACIEGKPRSVRHRQHQFHRLHDALIAAGASIVEALQGDNGFLRREAVLEYSLALRELRSTYESVSLEAEIAAAKTVEQGQDSLHRKVGVGIVYIRPDSTRADVYGTLSPLCAALAAGNCIVVEMPNTTRRTTSILRRILLDSLDHETFAVSDTVPPTEFLEQCVVVQQNTIDTDLSNIISTTAKKLVSFPSSSLNIFFVDRTADLRMASRCVLEAKFAFRGTSSFAPAVVFVHEAVHGQFSDCLLQDLQAFTGLATAESGTISKVHERHVKTARSSSGFEGLISEPNGIIAFIKDLQNYKALVKSEAQKSPTLLLYSATSMDDMIDSIANLTGNPLDTPSSAFIFASLPEAKYLANAVGADFTCVNTFPVELLVGPKFPSSIGLIADTKALLRYNREAFEESRPVILTPTSISQMVENGITLEQPGLQSKFLDWTELMQAPLRPTVQRLGKRKDFFAVAIGIGSSVAIGIPLLILTAFMGNYMIRRL